MRTNLDPALKAALRESLLRTEADPRTLLEFEAFGLKRCAAVGEEEYDAGRLPRPIATHSGTLRSDPPAPLSLLGLIDPSLPAATENPH